jgi:hypothetical protein
MPYFRVTYVGYVEGDFDTEEDAKEEFLSGLNEDYTDAYGRSREDMVCVEEFDEVTGEWKP